MTVELGTLLLEVLGVLGAVCVVVAVLRSSGQSQIDVRLVAGGVIAAIMLTLALGGLADAGWSLNQIRRTGVGARAGLESCLTEQGGPAVAVRLQFINWVKARLPADAVYQLLPYTPPPDDWCVTLVLLPSLPAGPGGRADWAIAFGTLPPDLQARIARKDPSVQVFAPGYALAKESAR